MGAVTTHDWRVVAALYVGLFWNAGFFAIVSWRQGYIGLLDLGTSAAFLAAGFFLAGARAPLDSLVHDRCGGVAELLLVRILLLLWLVSWLGENVNLAATCLLGELAGFLFVLAVALPCGGNAPQGAYLLVRLAIALVLGPLLGAVRSVPDAVAMVIVEPAVLPSLHMGAPLLWAAPALLLAGYLAPSKPRQAAVWGVGVGMWAASGTALLTIAAAGLERVRYRKVPDYIGYIFQHGSKMDLIRLALLALTLIIAIRFAAQFVHTLAPAALTQRLPRWLFILLFCAAGALVETRWIWHNHSLATLLAIPFVPLAGVLSVRGPVPRWSAHAAWTAGFVLA